MVCKLFDTFCVHSLMTVFMMLTIFICIYVLFVDVILHFRNTLNRMRNRRNRRTTTNPRNRARIERLAEVIKFKTVNYLSSDKLEKEELLKMHDFLKKSFPKVHSSSFIECTVINRYSLLYHVKGTNESFTPYMLCAHLDVLPDGGFEWKQPPFAGVIKDGFINGRGTLSGKQRLMGIMEALETMLDNDSEFEFRRSLYLAFGHDKEVGGVNGACAIADHLIYKQVKLEYILDEGTCIMHNIVPDILTTPMALIGVTEKAELEVELTVSERTGQPAAKKNAIITLSKALLKLNDSVFPESIGTVEDTLFQILSKHIDRFIPYYHLLKFRNFVLWFLQSSCLNETYRATSEVTYICANKINNKLSAVAGINVRFPPTQSSKEVLNYIRKTINNNHVDVNEICVKKPPRISSTTSFGYNAIKHAIQYTLPQCHVAPVTNTSITDTKWYNSLSECIYRFNPVHLTGNNAIAQGGSNERISELNYLQVVDFFIQLITLSNY